MNAITENNVPRITESEVADISADENNTYSRFKGLPRWRERENVNENAHVTHAALVAGLKAFRHYVSWTNAAGTYVKQLGKDIEEAIDMHSDEGKAIVTVGDVMKILDRAHRSQIIDLDKDVVHNPNLQRGIDVVEGSLYSFKLAMDRCTAAELKGNAHLLRESKRRQNSTGQGGALSM